MTDSLLLAITVRSSWIYFSRLTRKPQAQSLLRELPDTVSKLPRFQLIQNLRFPYRTSIDMEDRSRSKNIQLDLGPQRRDPNCGTLNLESDPDARRLDLGPFLRNYLRKIRIVMISSWLITRDN